ncbi:CRTAC1 family protein [Roseimaritima sediminicola]|uniref:CRTAC1 family protein n=1 Tax=Roseimaritima sediminicola TaxID=2662066 RepID=UPI00129824BE|nr:CRTAC1 family protein [Roseimaritima sediminicola]
MLSRLLSTPLPLTTPRVLGVLLGAFILIAGGCDTNPAAVDDAGPHATAPLADPAEPKPVPAADVAPTPEPQPAASGNPGLPATAAVPSQAPRELIFPEPTEDDWFANVAGTLGIDFAYRDGSQRGFLQLIESVGGGVASLDYDRDGWQDFFFTGGGQFEGSEDALQVTGLPSRLYRNLAAERFEDISRVSGLGDAPEFLTHGTTVADIDADGFPDLLVAGYRGVQLWRNQGDGTFRPDAQPMGLQHDHWNTTPAAADVDGDGLVDVYLMTYAQWQPDPSRSCLNDQRLRDICGPTMFPGAPDALFRHRGERFEAVREAAGLVDANRGLGVVAADFDNNGWIDFAVVNDVEENQLYSNSGELPLAENGSLQGIAYSNSGEREGSMGVDLGDYNNDGYADLWYANYVHQDNSLMRSIQGSGFVHAEAAVGLVGVSRRWVGFGTGFADFDADGWEDLFVVNGHVAYQRLDSPYYQPAQLFRNVQGKRFEEVTARGGPYFQVEHSARGAAKVDFDNDGAIDLVVVHQNEPVAVLRNRHASEGHWLRLELVGTAVERGAVGARVQLLDDNRPLWRWVFGGGSYLSHSDARVLFPTAGSEPQQVLVTWLGGRQERFTDLATGRTHVLIEGRGEDTDAH